MWCHVCFGVVDLVASRPFCSKPNSVSINATTKACSCNNRPKSTKSFVSKAKNVHKFLRKLISAKSKSSIQSNLSFNCNSFYVSHSIFNGIIWYLRFGSVVLLLLLLLLLGFFSLVHSLCCHIVSFRTHTTIYWD